MRYSLTRKTMGKTISEHQAVAFMLADMAMGVEVRRPCGADPCRPAGNLCVGPHGRWTRVASRRTLRR